LVIGLVGSCASLFGMWSSQYLGQHRQPKESSELVESQTRQLKTEMTGIPIVRDGHVAGYIVFQVSCTINASKLTPSDLNVAPYILDATIRASYESTADGKLEFNAKYIQRLSELIMEASNQKLKADIVSAVNVEQFNYVPKDEIRGKVLSGASE
jgi:hypothetical protein